MYHLMLILFLTVSRNSITFSFAIDLLLVNRIIYHTCAQINKFVTTPHFVMLPDNVSKYILLLIIYAK